MTKLLRACQYIRVFELESSITRLAQFEKCEFTKVNDHFENKHNAVIGLYRQTLLSLIALLFATNLVIGQPNGSLDNLIVTKEGKNSFALAAGNKAVDILVDQDDHITVKTVVGLFADDVERVTGLKPGIKNKSAELSKTCVIVGTIEGSEFIQELIRKKKIDVSDIENTWESCIIQVVENPFRGVKKALVIAGSDRRGAAYGLLELSKQMGVSPWYYFADVPVQEKDEVYVKAGRYIQHSPSVKYRGIFINDEMWGIRPWAMNTLAPDEGSGLGPTTYSEIFELLLRLKANLIWPAMHRNTIPFNTYEENKVVADKYGIVMGSSHIEPMLRNNMAGAEWDEEYPGEPWDYVKKRDEIYKYWEDRVIANGKYENFYTLGKRGKDDHAGSDITIPVLEQIFADQRNILKEWVNEDVTEVPQVLIPYTEVLGLYNQGLEVPDDITICWPDDNFGNIRQLPTKEEQQRSGGSGIYYHFQWLNGATTAYPWLYTTPLGLTWTEMKKAYDYHARELWVVNVGDIKPAEIGIDYFMQMAWDISGFEENNPRQFLIDWASGEFGPKHAAQIADIMMKHYELGYARRPEQMMMYRAGEYSWEWFSLYNYNDEAQRRIDAYDALIQEVDEVYESLPYEQKDAFFQMVLYNVKSAGLHNKKVIYGQKSYSYGKESRSSAARYAKLARAADKEIHNIIDHYNTGLLTVGSKWNHMASLPGPWGAQYRQWDLPPLSDYAGVGAAKIQISPEGGDLEGLPGLSVYNNDKRFIDIYNSGGGSIEWNSETSDSWIKLSKSSGVIDDETRIWVSIDWDKAPLGKQLEGYITINGGGESKKIAVPVFNPSSPRPETVKGFVESNGYVSMEAEHFSNKEDRAGVSWNIIEGLGRTGNSVTVLPTTIPPRENITEIKAHSPMLEYDMYLFTTDTVSVTFNCAPSQPINENYKLRIAVAFDDEEPQIVGYSRGNSDVMANLMTLHSTHIIRNEGQHKLKVWMVDPGIVIDKIIIDTGGVEKSYLGPPESTRFE